jgi:glycine/D-amino acid oxidase-like deaminating enzyme
VIIGGGVMGLSIAHALAAAGTRPLVLERRFLGAGSTGKSGAIIRQHYSLELTATMARDSLRAYSRFEDEIGGGAGFVRCGMAIVIAARHREGLRRNLEMQRRLGIRTDELDARQIRDAVPGAVTDDESVGCYEPDAGYADPLRTLQSLAAAVRRLGGEIREEVEVTGFVGESRVTGVRTAGGVIEADHVVVAAGPWAARVMTWVGWKADIEAVRVQSAVLRRPLDFAAGPVVIDFQNEMYAKHAAETHVGSISASEVDPADPDAYDETADHAYLETAHDRVARRLPAMRRAVRHGGYGALYAVTPDWHPLVGRAGPDGLYLCAGFSGHGFKLAPSIGKTVAAELLGETPPYDFGVLRPDRFAEQMPVVSQYEYSILG